MTTPILPDRSSTRSRPRGFAPGTLVRTPRGVRSIETLYVGGTVLTEDQRVLSKAYVLVIHCTATTDLRRIYFSDGSSVDSTASNRFLDAKGSLWCAEHLGAGMVVRGWDRGIVRVVRVEPIRTAIPQDVFELALDCTGAYFANGRLVEASCALPMRAVV